MADAVFEAIIQSKVDGDFTEWLVNYFKKSQDPPKCSIEDFAVFFLNFLRAQTERFLKGNSSSSCNTPRKLTASGQVEPSSSLTDVKALSALVASSSRTNPTTAISLSQQQQNISDLKTSSAEISTENRQRFAEKTVPRRLFSPDGQLSSGKGFIKDKSFELDVDSLQLRSTTPCRNDSNTITTTASSSRNKNVSSFIFEGSSFSDAIHTSAGNLSFEDSPSTASCTTPVASKSFENRFRNSGSNTSTPVTKQYNNNESNSTKKSRPQSSGKGRSPASLCLGDFLVTSNRSKRRSGGGSGGNGDGNNNLQSPATPVGKELGRQYTPNDGHKASDSVTVGLKKSSKVAQNDFVVKPKRRVVPTPVNKTTSTAFTSPAFRNENNLLEIAKEEIMDRNSFPVTTEREVLKTEITAIAKTLEKEIPSYPQTLHAALKDKLNLTQSNVCKTVKIDLTKVTNRPLLERIVDIHSALINLNLIISVLNEVSYLLNLISYEYEEESSPENVDQELGTRTQQTLQSNKVIVPFANKIDSNLINIIDNEVYLILRNVNNCVYFAIQTLIRQKHLLALFDVTTLRVILDNDRIDSFSVEFKEFLNGVYSHKINLETLKSRHEMSFRSAQNFNKVFYQEDNDTRDNFTSDREFAAFKKQRDLFYAILKTWECKHINPQFSFGSELGPKVRSLLSYSDHPINMSHLAKLFTSQLIISSNFIDSPSDLNLPNVDPEKLTKLSQRLEMPSNFSTAFQFPGKQAFFRNFYLTCSSCVIFSEQLKITLTTELIEMNNSSYEILNLPSTNEQHEYLEYVVRPETVSTMLILAKFLGLVMSRPHNYDGVRNALVDKKQIEMRNMIRPTFDIVEILKKSIMERKLIITVPWLVQYISMLDYVAVRLSYYHHVIQILYDIYICLACNNNGSDLLKMRPTSIFIIRSCLGWLFEQLNLPEDYYKYRSSRQDSWSSLLYRGGKEITVVVPASLSGAFKQNDPIFLSNVETMSTEWKCTLTQQSNEIHSSAKNQVKRHHHHHQKSNDDLSIVDALDPMLENILNVACPFLADFRVSIMPTKLSKSVSRTGRYRYITTRISETPALANAAGTTLISQQDKDAQTKLSEAFLQSQSLSMRRIIEFLIERITSAVIKDYQMKILIPSKSEALDTIQQNLSTTVKQVMNDLRIIYTETHKTVLLKWDTEIPKMIETRTKKSLDALLPDETPESVKKTCMSLVVRRCRLKADEWKATHFPDITFYSKDIRAEADRLCNGPPKKSQIVHTSLNIDLDKGSPSDVFMNLQNLLHFTSKCPELVNASEIQRFCDDLLNCVRSHKLPSTAIRISGLMTVYLMQNLIENHYKIVGEHLIQKFINIWLCDELKPYIIFAEKTNSGDEENQTKEENCDNILLPLVKPYFVRALGGNSEGFECLAQLLIALVNANLITLDFLNEQFVGLFKIDWSNEVLNLISHTLGSIRVKTSSSLYNLSDDDAKSQLFMEMLTDFSRGTDQF